MRDNAQDAGTVGFGFDLTISQDNGDSLILTVNPDGQDLNDIKVLEIKGNEIIRFE